MGCAIPRNSIVVQPCTDECFTLLLVLGVVRGLCRLFYDSFLSIANPTFDLKFSFKHVVLAEKSPPRASFWVNMGGMDAEKHD